MRSLFVLSAFALFGCVDNALPIETSGATASSGSGATTAGGTTAGSTTAGTTTAGTTTAGSTTAGTTTAGSTTAGTTTAGSTTAGTSAGTSGTGGMGAKCASACDCTAGLACFQNQCVNGLMGVTLYCCDDSASCPSGQFCQSSSGSFGMCGTSNGTTTTTGSGGTSCKTACDCPTGEACFQNACFMAPMGKLFCCDDANACPSGQFCQGEMGNLTMCPAGGGSGNGGGGGNGTTNGGGPRDAGTGPNCQAVTCNSDTDCQNAGCGTCTRRGTCR